MPSCTILKTIGKYLAKIGQNPNFVASLVKRILEKSWPQSQKTKEEVHLNVQQHNSFKKQRTSSGMWVCVCTICLAIRRTLSHFLDTFFLTLSFILGSPLSMGSFRTDCDHFWIRLWTQNITVFFGLPKQAWKMAFLLHAPLHCVPFYVWPTTHNQFPMLSGPVFLRITFCSCFVFYPIFFAAWQNQECD